MPRASRRVFTRGLAALASVAVVASVAVAVTTVGDDVVVCPPGTVPNTGVEPRIVAPDQRDQLPEEYRGPGEVAEFTTDCRPDRVESFDEIAARNAQQDAAMSAPFMAPAEGAAWSAALQRQAMVDTGVTVPGSDGTLVMHGEGPLNFDEDPYDSGTGIVDSTGRIDDFFYDEVNNRLFAAIGTAGVWMSEDRGATWRSIGDTLPSQITSAVSWSPNGGPDGTVLVLTGEHTFGGSAFTGIGAFWSDDLGATWHRAEGPPEGTLAFAIEVDPTDPDVVYAATGRGLWRSADAGRTYVDVTLPVGTCEGDYNIETCNFAHFVTDVVVKAPGGVGEDTDGGDVMAVVGYRAGMLEDVSGDFVHSEGNGVYVSSTGEAGTFERLTGLDDAAGGQERLGRIELGPATGDEQNHDIVYAIVEDAVLFNGGRLLEIIPEGLDPVGLPTPTFLNGVYVSEDFGQTWSVLADDTELATLCLVNRSVYCLPGLIQPGAQSWYNMWIEPDPTRAIGGVPTRVAFGLEEVWQNRLSTAPAPVNSRLSSFEVIGAYYGGADCLLVVTDCAVSSNLGITTTHPDQHDGIWLPVLDDAGEPTGGVELLVGHDGGLSRQVDENGASTFSQDTWVLDQDGTGLDTLLPYSVAAANDGTAVAGLQDNGTALIDPTADFRQFEVQGADGTATAIDPEDSSYGIASSQTNSLLGYTTDRFLTITSLTPTPSDGTFLFVPPLDMNLLDSDHIITGGQQVIENTDVRGAGSDGWSVAIDLGVSDREPRALPEGTDPVDPPTRQTSATALYGDAAYAAFCAPCHILQTPYPYDAGIVTNVGTADVPEPGTDTGWHFATAEGLPDRYVTDLAIDPYDPAATTVYATLGGYTRKWVPPGTGADEAENVGEGHVFVSTDAGESFTDISGNLPDTPVLTIEQRGDQLLVGTDLGPFISSDLNGTEWAPLAGADAPTIPVMDIQMKADDPDVAFLAVYGRGVMRYEFPEDGDLERTVTRLAGAGREATSVAVSASLYTSADTVVLARSDAYADALAGAPLAADLGAPLLLTASGALHPDVAAEIQRLGATTAVLLGGEAALSSAVEQELADLGVTDVVRYGASNRFGTAALIAEQLPDADTAWVVKGNDADPTRGWPDAMSIAPVAAHTGQPILLTETDRLPEETVGALDGRTDARIVGGTAAVSPGVEDQLADLVTLGDRVAGDNRFATSVAAAEVGLEEGLGLSHLWLARADNFADALSAGPSVAATRGSLVLVDSAGLDASLDSGTFVTDNACLVRAARIAGGTAAISETVVDQVRALLDACPAPQGYRPPPAQALIPGEVEGDDPLPTDVVAGPYGFEDDAEGWSTAVNGNPLSMWTRGAPGHESDTSFQVDGYNSLADATLTSPEIDVDGTEVAVAWWHAVEMEGGGYDEVAFEWSADGESWTRLGAYGNTPGFPEFSEQVVRFTPDAGTIQIRFHLYADEICDSVETVSCGSESLTGAFVDDVTVLS
ncbi:cell wall-binding repeat-containing protein [Euzebya pacifica]|uniref:cell wall-binding repeat-containing protein n=1 Tax=Euzebya pacifica TaxID=1608957 RepID=UPI0030F5D33D